jgi:hypothetical protein
MDSTDPDVEFVQDLPHMTFLIVLEWRRDTGMPDVGVDGDKGNRMCLAGDTV